MKWIDSNEEAVAVKVDLDSITEEIWQKIEMEMKFEVRWYIIEIIQRAVREMKVAR